MFSEQPYDIKLITGALLWHETKIAAHLMLKENSAAKARLTILKDNLFQRRSKKTASNILGLVIKRLESVPHDIVSLIASSDMELSKQATFVAALAESRFLREFVRDVVSEKLESFDNSISVGIWDQFWNSCVSKDPSLSEAREKSAKELRSTILKILVETGILERSSSKRFSSIKFLPELSKLVSELFSQEFKYCVRAFL